MPVVNLQFNYIDHEGGNHAHVALCGKTNGENRTVFGAYSTDGIGCEKRTAVDKFIVTTDFEVISLPADIYVYGTRFSDAFCCHYSETRSGITRVFGETLYVAAMQHLYDNAEYKEEAELIRHCYVKKLHLENGEIVQISSWYAKVEGGRKTLLDVTNDSEIEVEWPFDAPTEERLVDAMQELHGDKGARLLAFITRYLENDDGRELLVDIAEYIYGDGVAERVRNAVDD